MKKLTKKIISVKDKSQKIIIEEKDKIPVTVTRKEEDQVHLNMERNTNLTKKMFITQEVEMAKKIKEEKDITQSQVIKVKVIAIQVILAVQEAQVLIGDEDKLRETTRNNLDIITENIENNIQVVHLIDQYFE